MARINWKSADEVAKEQEAKELQKQIEVDRQKQQEAVQAFVVDQVTKMIAENQLSEEERNRFIDVYSPFTPGITYSVGDKVRHAGVVYELIQAHTSQADWVPADVPALFKVFYQRIAEDGTGNPVEVIPKWKQPTGGHDAYKKGDKVSYQIGVYESVIDGNVWSPIDYPAGWKVIS